MVDVGVDADGCSAQGDVLVAGDGFGAGEVVATSEGGWSSHELFERSGLVVDVADLQSGRAVAGHEDRSACLESGEHALFAVGHRVVGAEHHGERHGRGGESPVGVRREESVLAEQLVEAVFDLGLASVVGVVFGDGPVLRLVGDGGAGEHIVADCVAEELHHDVDVFGVVRRHVVHTVPFGAAEHCPELLVVGAVGDQSAD